ncbi:MAG: hypothetical protein COB98_05750 [Flavobacteriaceae bacterium]|nr:MAG: hypothetical protein COB98_05750 [Flavobacteriaceae bacterium]
MKNIKNILTAFFAISLLFTSCTDDDKNPFPTFIDGGYAKFGTEVFPSTFDDAQNILFTGVIEDANNNLVEYTLAITATVGGKEYTNDQFVTFTTFPSEITINTQNIADALEIDPSELDFGDSFKFKATVTTNTGTIYTSVKPKTGKDENDVTILTGGNTDPKLLNGVGYKNAMSFETIIACPFVQSEIIGTYKIVQDDWSDFDVDAEVEIVAGDTENTYRILHTTNTYIDNGATSYFEVTVDLETGASTLKSNQAFEYTDWKDITIKGKGLTISCAGIINLSNDYYETATSGWWGKVLKLKKI